MHSKNQMARITKIFTISAPYLLWLTGCGMTSPLDTTEPQALVDSERCGNGKIETAFDEQCDGKNLGGATCQSLEEGTGTLACGPTCYFDVSDCTGPVFGDGGIAPVGSTSATASPVNDLLGSLLTGNTGTTTNPGNTAGTNDIFSQLINSLFTGNTGTTTNPGNTTGTNDIFSQLINSFFSGNTDTATDPMSGLFGNVGNARNRAETDTASDLK